MKDERNKILELLEAGQINVDEAVQLLKALKDSEPQAPPQGPGDDTRAQPGPGVGDFAQEIFERIRANVQGSNLFQAAITAASGRTYKFEESFSGAFEPGSPVHVAARTRNGRIQVRGWNQDEYKVVLHKSVKATSEEEAQDIAADLAVVEHDGNQLAVTRREGNVGFSVGLRIDLYLPSNQTYNLDLETANGRLVVEDLTCDVLQGTTNNGRISLDHVEASRIVVRTSNGRVDLLDCSGDIQTRTSNGAVQLVANPGEGETSYDLQTSTGSIYVRVPADDETGCDIDATAMVGKVRVNVGSIDYLSDDRKWDGRSRLQARTPDYQDQSRRLKIRARTSVGSVKILEI